MKTHTFRCPLFRTFFVVAVAFGLGCIGGQLLVSGGRIRFDGLVFAGVLSLLIAVGATALLIVAFPVSVSPERTRCFDFWAIYHQVDWNSIREVRRVWLPGLPYVRVFSSQAPRPLWLPEFLVGMDRFRALVEKYAGPDHVLAKYLSKRGF